MKTPLLAIVMLLLFTGVAQAKIPLLNASCPGSIDVHADAGGPVYVDGHEGKLKVFNDNYYEATYQRTTISISINPDGSPLVSYTRRGGGNGICTLVGSSDNDNASAGDTPSGKMTPGQMTAYCKGEAAGQYNTRPANVKAGAPVKGVNGGLVVTGSVSLGAGGNPPFQCLFDRAGRFQSINWL
jgi:hypothetical protein